VLIKAEKVGEECQLEAEKNEKRAANPEFVFFFFFFFPEIDKK
jgi:hypothetical protein